jgi:hypothetical protein
MAKDTLLFSLPFSFSFLLAASFDYCFGSFRVRVLSAHTLRFHCPLHMALPYLSVGGCYRSNVEYPDYSSCSNSSRLLY